MNSDIIIANVSNSQNDTVSFERKFSKSTKILDLKVSKTLFWENLNTQTIK